VGGDARARAWRPRNSISWDDTEAALVALRLESARFFAQAARSERPWRLLWCAGSGVVATPPDALPQETMLLTRFLADVAGRVSGNPALAEAGTLRS
jgi:UDP-glucose 4-epimerase